MMGGNGGGGGRKMPGKRVTQDDILRATAGAEYSGRTEGDIAAQSAAQRERDARERLAQQEHEQQDAWRAIAQARSYNPADFQAYTPEQLQAFKAQGTAWLKTAQSYNDALSQVEYDRMVQQKRSGQQEPEPPQTFASPNTGPVATGQKMIHVSPEAAAAAEAAAMVSPTSPVPPRPLEREYELSDATNEEYSEDDDEAATRESETGDLPDSGVVAEEEGDIV
jgi:hypothetical protein